MSGPPADLRQAAAVLYLHRHRLSPGILRTIQNVWVCASAARYGGPLGTGWAEDPDACSEHDVSECEADDGAADLADIGASTGTMPSMNLREIARQLEQDLRADRRPGITDASQIDVQALCVAKEAGELADACHRHAGKARRDGTMGELEGRGGRRADRGRRVRRTRRDRHRRCRCPQARSHLLPWLAGGAG